MTIALIDGDVVAYRIGFSLQKKGVLIDDADSELRLRCDQTIRAIIDETGAERYRVFLSGGTNYRLKYNPEYKANRDPANKPILLAEVRQYLVDYWNAEVCDGIEADDAMGIAQWEAARDDLEGGVYIWDHQSVICSIDKDMLQIPGWHYNFVTQHHRDVDPYDGLKFFYKQLLIGDTIDNIFGVYGIGKVKADRIVDPCEDELEMFEAVQSRYDSDARLIMNGICLKIQTYPGELWEPPLGAQIETNEDGETEGPVPLQE